MSPANKKTKTKAIRRKGQERLTTIKSIRKKPVKRPAKPAKKAPVTLHLFRELEFIRDLPDAAFVIDRHGTVLAWNRSMEELTGFSASEIIGKDRNAHAIPFYGVRRPILIDIALNPDITLAADYERLCCDGRVVTAITRSARPKGKEVILWGRASPILDEKGNIIGAIETIRDITRQELMEEKLRESEERFRALLHSASDIIRVIDRRGKIVFDTGASGRMLGYPPGFFIGKDPLEFIHPDDVTMVKHELAKVYEKTNKGVPTEFRIRKADGSYCWVESVGNDMSGMPGIDGIVTTTRFIDERKNAEKILRESEERYRTFLSHSSEGIFRFETGCEIPVTLPVDDQVLLFAEHGYLAECNDAFARMYGIEKAEDIIGAPIGQVMEINSEITLDYMRTFIRSGYHVGNFESREKDRHGNLRWFSNSLTGIIHNGKILRLWGVQRDITDHKKAELQLAESEAKFRTMVEASPDMIWEIDHRGNFTYISPRSIVQLGYTPEELNGKPMFSLIPPESVPSIKSQFITHIKEKNSFSLLEIPAFHRDGRLRIIEIHSVSVFDKDGQLTGFRGIARDITDQKNAESTLRNSEEKYRALIEHSSDLIYSVDFHGVVTSVNPAVTPLFGYRPDEVVGHPITEFMPPDSLSRATQAIQQKMKGDTRPFVYELELIAKDGTLISTEANSRLRTFADGSQDILGVARDVTRRKKTEEDLRVATEKYTKAFLSTPDAITISDLESGRFIEVNDAATKIFGFSRDELIGKNSLDLGIWPDKRVRDAMIDQIRKCGHIVQYEVVERRKNGEEFYASITADTLHIGTTRYLIATTRDITERRQIEENLAYSNTILRTEQETSIDGILVVDENGKILSFNSRFIEIMGIPEELVSSRVDEPVLAFVTNKMADPKQFLDRVRYLYHNREEKITDEILLKDGRVLERYSAPMLGEDKRYYGRVWFFHDITGRKRLDEALRKSRQLFSDIISFLPDATLVIDGEGRVLAWNRALEELSGIPASAMIGKGEYEYSLWQYNERRPILIDLVLHPDIEYRRSGYTNIHVDGPAVTAETIFYQETGKWNSFSLVASPLFDSNGNVIGAIESMRDITSLKKTEMELARVNTNLEQIVKERTHALEQEIAERKKAEEVVRASLEEKIVLLREVHHRVKNNLQIIISLLNLQSRTFSDDRVSMALKETTQRIRTMSMVHEKLYNDRDLARIEFTNYLSSLARSQVAFYQIKPGTVNLMFTGDPVMVDINTAIPLGLIINELISNSLKYAFPEGRSGVISIGIAREDHAIRIRYHDDGIGIPQDLDWRNTQSLGLRLVVSLIEQVRGTIELDRGHGTSYDILVPDQGE